MLVGLIPYVIDSICSRKRYFLQSRNHWCHKSGATVLCALSQAGDTVSMRSRSERSSYALIEMVFLRLWCLAFEAISHIVL